MEAESPACCVCMSTDLRIMYRYTQCRCNITQCIVCIIGAYDFELREKTVGHQFVPEVRCYACRQPMPATSIMSLLRGYFAPVDERAARMFTVDALLVGLSSALPYSCDGCTDTTDSIVHTMEQQTDVKCIAKMHPVIARQFSSFAMRTLLAVHQGHGHREELLQALAVYAGFVSFAPGIRVSVHWHHTAAVFADGDVRFEAMDDVHKDSTDKVIVSPGPDRAAPVASTRMLLRILIGEYSRLLQLPEVNHPMLLGLCQACSSNIHGATCQEICSREMQAPLRKQGPCLFWATQRVHLFFATTHYNCEIIFGDESGTCTGVPTIVVRDKPSWPPSWSTIEKICYVLAISFIFSYFF